MRTRSVCLLAILAVLSTGAANAVPLVLGDDDFDEVALAFTFNFFGVNYNSIFVGSNGFITFGSGDTDFSESVPELLNDQPRIAALWDDLRPPSGGTIDATGNASQMVVAWTGVPEFFATGSNTFDITLDDTGDIWLNYGALSALDGLVGISPGGGAADPGETDFSAGGGPFAADMTRYELFSAGDNDLAGSSIHFNASAAVIPEPTTLLLFGAGVIALGLRGLRRRRKPRLDQ